MSRGRLAAIALALLPGRSLAEEGLELYFSEILVGQIAGVARPGLTCAGCHGRTGTGPPEGRGRIPLLGGSALTQRPDGAVPYDADGFARALVEGVTPDGRTLSSVMPRFAVTAAQARQLWAALALLEREERAGIEPDRVTVVVPTPPARRPEAEVFRERVLRALEARGQTFVYGRAIHVAIEESERALSDVRALVALGPELDPEGRAARRIGASGLPILMPRGTPAGAEVGDLVDWRPDERDVAQALQSLRGPAGSPDAGPSPVLLDSDAFAALRAAPPHGGTVFLSMALARERPEEIDSLVAGGVAFVALRPVTWDDTRIAEEAAAALVGALTLAGRDVTRTTLLATLARLRGRALAAVQPRVEAVRLPAPAYGR